MPNLDSVERAVCIVVPVLMCWWTHKTLKKIRESLEKPLEIREELKLVKPLTSSVAIETAPEDESEDDTFLQIKEYNNEVEILKDSYAGEWCYDKTLIILSDDTTMNQALEKMHDTRSTCALLYTEGSLMGILDTRDIVRFILRSSSSMSSSAHKAVRRCIIASSNVSVNEICKHLCSGMRYIAVCSTNGGHQIVSQRAMVSAIMNEYYANINLSQHLDDTPIPLNCLKHLVCCNDNETAKKAFELMSAYNITSLPIIDQNGFARGIISATDILYTRKNLESINDSVITFVESSRADANVSRNANCIVSCKKNDTLISVLHTMIHEEVHHVYILEEDIPIGVVSFIDILKHLSNKVL
jgi:CBS domain-containing protein